MTAANVTRGKLPDTIAGRIRWARRRVGLSQEKFAEQVGTSRRHVMRWEGGAHAPARAYARRIAEVTGTRPELFSDAEGDEEGD